MRSITGQFTDGVSAIIHDVTLSLDYCGGQLVFCSIPEGEVLGAWDLTEIEVDSQHGGDRYHVQKGVRSGAMVTSSNRALLQALRDEGCPQKTVTGHRNPVAFILTLSVAIALLVSGVYLSLPAVSRGLAAVIPIEYERTLGVNIEGILEWTYCESDEAANVLTDYANLLGPERAGLWEVHITPGSQPNAFALPGGVIVFTSGAIAQSESLEEILGVLAHEIEHVQRRHVLSSVVRSTILTSLWSLTIGDYAGLMVVDPYTAHSIANLKFSRDIEREADAGAVRRLRNNNLPVEGLGSFLKRIGHGKSEVPEWFSSHPATANRVQAINEASSKAQPHPDLPDNEREDTSLAADWELVRASCVKTDEAEEQ